MLRTLVRACTHGSSHSPEKPWLVNAFNVRRTTLQAAYKEAVQPYQSCPTAVTPVNAIVWSGYMSLLQVRAQEKKLLPLYVRTATSQFLAYDFSPHFWTGFSSSALVHSQPA